ncbi:MAG: family 20 glycosylhydrolase [Akkermansia sp.]
MRHRNITIVPEIDIPGHSAAAIVSYPKLKLSARPLAEVPVSLMTERRLIHQRTYLPVPETS